MTKRRNLIPDKPEGYGTLVLSRAPGETIKIAPSDQPVFITVSGKQGDKIKLAVQAPLDVAVHREPWNGESGEPAAVGEGADHGN